MTSKPGPGSAPDRGGRSRAAFAAATVLALLVLAGLVGLGTWQIRRLSCKRDLIARVAARVHAAPIAAPGPGLWPHLTADADAYRHVAITGVFDNDRETATLAVTEGGGGFWVLTPFHTDAGFTVLVNRGFVPPERRDPATRPAGQIAGATGVTGLLRMSEPGGGFLRSNDPGAGRWYSRDVGAIATAHGLGPVAPYFIDADATPNAEGGPIGGLTVVAFPNNHLVYAITWFALAALLAGAGVWAIRDERRARTIDASRIATAGSRQSNRPVAKSPP